MDKYKHCNIALLLVVFLHLYSPNIDSSQRLSKYLSVTTSANPESNRINSFIIVPDGNLILEGIKSKAQTKRIGKQIPFVIEYIRYLRPEINVQWLVKIKNKRHGKIKVLSNFKGESSIIGRSNQWSSEVLDSNVANRDRLVFRPVPFEHVPKKYKKGKGKTGKRTRYGGGTRKIDRSKYNPRYAYEVTLHLYRDNKRVFTYKTNLQMDRKDMIRQEYINHYKIEHYRGEDVGNIAVPMRSEISAIPKMPVDMEGNPLTESQYKLIIDDGMSDLANKINIFYTKHLREVRAKGGLIDRNKKRRQVPDNKLWISSGWRNPERNEWYSNFVNGNHQKGGAVDITIMAPAASTESALGYWLLWETLKKYRKRIGGTWQLESNGIPFKRKDYWQDIDPMNGIPDAFDRADHLHANVEF